jgi:outer membrane lipoprotein-sorting protein
MGQIVWFLILSLFNPALTAEDVSLRTEHKIRSLLSLQAKFEQLYYSATVSTPLKESGRFHFKKPALMKWEYKDPEEKIYLLKEGWFWEYLPEEKQLIKYDLSSEEHESEILSLLSGQRGIMDNYLVEFSPFPTDNSKSYQLKLIPKQGDPETFILLEVDERSWLIQKAIFIDWAGNKTEYRFSRMKTNLLFPEGFFDLKIPPDVEIIEHKTGSGRARS